MLRGFIDGLGAIEGFDHLKTIMFQVQADEAHHALFIVHDQDFSVSVLVVYHMLFSRFPRKASSQCGQSLLADEADDLFFGLSAQDFDKIDLI